jgi:hypothetical protein
MLRNSHGEVTQPANGGVFAQSFGRRDVRRLEEDELTEVREVPAASECQLAVEGRFFQAYNQEAFRYFLALERERAQRSSRPLLLLLASLAVPSAAGQRRMDAAVAQKLFSGLWHSTRETDFIGWFHEGQTAGAVLTPHSGVSSIELSHHIRARVSDVLRAALPRSVRHRLRVRVFQLKSRNARRIQATDDGTVRS